MQTAGLIDGRRAVGQGVGEPGVDLLGHGIDAAVGERPELQGGINTRNGVIVNEIVAAALA